MPKWVKTIVVIFGAGTLLLIFAGFLAARVLSGVAEGFQRQMDQASADGTAAGLEGKHGDCVDQTVKRVTRCEGVICAPKTTTFLYACLESVPESAEAFCRSVPPSHDEEAVGNWSRRTCRTNGNTGDEVCVVTLVPTASFCESEQAR